MKELLNGLSDTCIVEKSRPLVLMKEVPFALGELKILDTYCSRINARDPSAFTVRFSKEEYEDLMGIDRMRPERLGKYVDSMMGKIITVPDGSGWRKYTLFSYSQCSQDETGQWWIDLSCTEDAKRLFFNLEGIGYIRYQLKNVLPLTSKYSILLYLYLLDNRYRREWRISVDELRKKVFRCEGDSYEEFKIFRRAILNKSLAEINAKTDLTFDMTLIKAGRRITDIQWTLLKDDILIPLPDEQAATLSEEAPSEPGDETFWQDAIAPIEATPAEIDEIVALARQHVPFSPDLDSSDLATFDYLRAKIKYLLARDSKKPIKHKIAYLKKIIQADRNE